MTWHLGRPAKRDVNHKQLTAFLRSIKWWHMDFSHHAGAGFDILTKHKDGYPLMLEIKPEGKLTESSFTESEKAMRQAFPEFWRCVQTVEQLAAAIGCPFEPIGVG